MVKTTKRILTVLLAVCLLFGMVSFAAGEETAGDTSATSGIDVVIVLDMTNSMRKENNRGNDPFGYRIDVTAMLIGMLDMEGSRVAIVPFAGKVMDDIMIKDLTDVSTTESRRDLINHIYEKSCKIQCVSRCTNLIIHNTYCIVCFSDIYHGFDKVFTI